MGVLGGYLPRCPRGNHVAVEVYRCPYCYRSYCTFHSDPLQHNCRAFQRGKSYGPSAGSYRHTGGTGYRWLGFFLIIWVAMILTVGVTSAVIGPRNIVILSLLDSTILLVLIYGLSGFRRHGAASKIFALLILFLLVGGVYANQSQLLALNNSSASSFFSGQASMLDQLIPGVVESSSSSSAITSQTTQSAASTIATSTATVQTSSTSFETSTVITSTTTKQSSTVSTSSQQATLSDPDIINNVANITYPTDYNQLATFALGLINHDRQQNGLSNVTLSAVPSGQQHADSMAYFGYFSHWDTQGLKPYMRYTMLGGTGYVAENIGLDYCTYSSISATSVIPTTCNLQTIENGLANSEYSMMNYDLECCNNGHRDNILNPSRTQASIGIAWNQNTDTIYFVEDLIDSVIDNLSLQTSGGVVTLQGTTQADLTGWTGSSSGASIGVYYDPTPTSLSVSQLSQDYQGSYDAGTLVTTVLAPCPAGYICSSGSSGFTYAQTWQVSGSFDIVFSLPQSGSGVYTLYLWPNGASEPITSLSILVTG